MPISDDDKEKLKAYMEFYKEQCAHGRHTEAQRQLVTTFLFAGAGALVALMGSLHFSILCLPIAILLFFLGVFGFRFVKIFETKWNETSIRRDWYRTEIQKILTIDGPPVPSIQESQTPMKGTLRTFWRRAFVGVWIAGLACVLIVGSVVYTNWRVSGKTICHSLIHQVVDRP